MMLLKTIPINKDGETEESVTYVCYHPLQVRKLLSGENVEPICCAVEYDQKPSLLKMPDKTDDTYPKAYLGNGVYAAFDGWQILLAANSYDHPTDIIALDPRAMQVLKDFEKKLLRVIKEGEL